ncbi:hypothetical protein BDV95DRAFT_308371 [Massariosphaeria phaeospora]|uniref:Uncharacterized protein n=1 Tax=Massariosphaeria phaeospora TaxID=100035 RepID=A0A7C8MCU8_9PLEO|nr:hypothetical protein BDV95DRAFT_308371 [Massariosphaeria phaeospora]
MFLVRTEYGRCCCCCCCCYGAAELRTPLIARSEISRPRSQKQWQAACLEKRYPLHAALQTARLVRTRSARVICADAMLSRRPNVLDLGSHKDWLRPARVTIANDDCVPWKHAEWGRSIFVEAECMRSCRARMQPRYWRHAWARCGARRSLVGPLDLRWCESGLFRFAACDGVITDWDCEGSVVERTLSFLYRSVLSPCIEGKANLF